MTIQPRLSRALLGVGMFCFCSAPGLWPNPAAAWPIIRFVDPPRSVTLVQAQTATDPELQPFEELNEALEAARSKLEQLTDAADLAAIAADLRRRLQAAEDDNRNLREQLERVAASQTAAARHLNEMEGRIRERDRQLEEGAERNKVAAAAAERSAAQAARLREQLEAAGGKLAAAEKARASAEGKLTDMQSVVESALGEAAALGRQLAELEEAGAEAKAELARVQDERDAARRQLQAERSRRQGSERELAETREALEERTLENAALEKQVAALRGAANQARDAARQNLEAVEEKIRLLNRALSEIKPGKEGRQPDQAPERGGPASAPARYPMPGWPPPDASEPSAVRTANAAESGDPAAFDQAQRQRSSRPITLAEATGRLPMEKRVQAQSLLADLQAEKHPGGMVMKVPGEELFALDSDVIEETAHDTLAKVAELIGLFEERNIQIIGHTDAMGDASYNQALSERRAELVKEFFVQNYELAETRLKVVGAGERQPIATNATRAGRRANRRIEVVIED